MLKTSRNPILLGCLLALLAACAWVPKKKTEPAAPPQKPSPVQTPVPEPSPKPATPTELPPAAPAPKPAPPPTSVAPPAPAEPVNPLKSLAHDPKEYRRDAAKHLYAKYPERIYAGKLPPLLKAVGVIDVVVGPGGQILELVWTRPPSHVPDVMRDIENMIRRAGPFPAPVNLRKVTYTETWLWHKSGQFQLDTLTEGQK